MERYLDLLEKNFVLFRVGGFSRNLRKDVTQSMRYYFVDCGIRNAVINQFQPLKLRPDIGALWENFVINERRRKNDYAHPSPSRLYSSGLSSRFLPTTQSPRSLPLP